MAEKERDREQAAQAIEALVKKLQARPLTQEELVDAAYGKVIIAQILGISSDEMFELATKGFTLLQANYFREAEQTFEALAFLNGLEPYFHNALGIAHLAQKNYEKAELCFNQAIRLNPKGASYYVNLGEVFLKTDRAEMGIRAFEEADRLDPEKKDFFVNRARAVLDFLRLREDELPPEEKEGEGVRDAPAKKPAGEKTTASKPGAPKAAAGAAKARKK